MTRVLELRAGGAEAGQRLDVALAAHEDVGSRAAAQRLIDAGRVLVDGVPRPKRHRLAAGELVTAELAEPEIAPDAGDDVTDLDAFDALDAALADGRLGAAVRVGVRSDEAPEEIVERADLTVEGIPGFTRVLEALAKP